VKNRIALGLADYKKNNMKLSETSFNYLERIIRFLQKKGTVYLVRMPVTKEMQDLEFEKFPQFNDKVSKVSEKNDIPYFNFINSNDFKFVDLHHMQKVSAFKISEQICDSVLEVKRISLN